MRVRGQQVNDGTNRLVRTVALRADQAIVSATPVDTGQARSNWLVSTISPRIETIPPYSLGSGGSTGAANVAAALAQGRAVIATRRDGDDIFIANSLDYIERLNEGFSAQAPAMFVEAAVAAAADSVENTRILPRGSR